MSTRVVQIVANAHRNLQYCEHRPTLCLKNDTDVAHYNFNAHQPISVIFDIDVAEKVFNQMVIFIPPL